MKFPKRTIRKLPLDNATVLLRADYNVPLNDDGTIADDFRIRSSLPTLKQLLDRGCRIVIVSHLGRPKGTIAKKYSLEPVAERLKELVDVPVRFVDDCTGVKVRMAMRSATNRSITLLENVRFHPEEEANDSAFAQRIVQDTQAKFFVQDAFGTIHRAHATTSAITQFLPSAAGLLVEREYTTIIGAMKRPKRPLVALLGGAKVSDKIEVIQRLVRLADQIVIGGAMANTFLAYRGYSVGKSKLEVDQHDIIDAIYNEARKKVGDTHIDSFIILPSDVAVAKKIDKQQERRVVDVNHVQDDDIILDIGDQSIERMARALRRANMVIWNGTMGIAELPEFAHGSARAALELAEHDAVKSIIGGGDTADFVLHWDARKGDSFDHVSTGGGASLDAMSGKPLPGIEALLEKQ